MQTKPVLYVFVNNHFDPTWRRCWERRFTVKDETYVSYADLQDYYMLDNLALARAHLEYKFEAESTMVARKFLERHPELRDELAALARAGRFAVTGGGEAIVDANMVHGESLVRNYLIGLLWVEETFGQTTRQAVRNDAFGNSAQLPQILRGCEIAWATGMSYSPAMGRYWRGLDGSTILHATLPIAAVGGGNIKYAPCPICHGVGQMESAPCAACAGRGIAQIERARLPGDINSAALEPFNAALVGITPEELLPNLDLPAWAAAQRDTYDVRFALEEEVASLLRPWLDAVDAPPAVEIHPGVELNPNNSGCWVTRIKTKQMARLQECALRAVETFAVYAALQGQPYPHARLNTLWQRLIFTLFHDAITATHVDPAYTELEDVWRAVDRDLAALRADVLSALCTPEVGTLSVFNPTGQPTSQITTAIAPAAHRGLVDDAGQPVPVLGVCDLGDGNVALDFVAVVPALDARVYHFCPTDTDPNIVTPLSAPVLENERFRVEADAKGLCSIFDKRVGRDIAQADVFRPGELLLEHDAGSPWATLHPDQTRVPLSSHTTLVAAERGAAFQRLIFAVETPRGMGMSGQALRAHVTVTLTEGIERVDFHVHAHWDACNHRVRVALPAPFAGRPCYEIPYGMLERQPYAPSFDWAGANGDWPALNWAGIETDDCSVALLNRGLPSYRIEPGGPDQPALILLSLLRSPVIPTYLHEPEFYTMIEWDGMRDAGEHAFDFAVTAYNASFAASTVVGDADSFNTGLLAVAGRAVLPALPSVSSDVARVAALKWAEQGDALILRLCEYRGRGGAVSVVLPDGFTSAARVNLLERQPVPLPIAERTVTLTLRPWEIATLCCTVS